MEIIDLVKEIIAICIGLGALAGGAAVISKTFNVYADVREFMKRCDGYDSKIKDLEDKLTRRCDDNDKKIERAHEYATESLQQMQEEKDAKLQEIRAEQCMLTYCMSAVLDGLHQLKCNGPVTEAQNKLEKYINEQAHK